ncbi:3,4-dihydroxy 2-butanone 4-phosphate synthase/GTP cyclohydrolase II [Nocardia transvalensis]|uniref:3,4-dihydroxy 2-butanone 4-phosphate synthase/GTP cyclohydrolase II n=1 Tax=Nocardia transvalensis TaxID=37333 RepID=A0A7W9PHZ2_9NOCA|nr:GTP cyclohydrolase II RibA [Nocardia transvalensis]MBB5916511.1 3,4-dihydroxy 2-butanone 4-phosphate synthase/GTP cyclohydrolase II [Nocardia transvalensis]
MTAQLDDTEYDGVPAVFRTDDTEHLLRRKGREMAVRVRELHDARDGGTILLFGAVADGCLVRIHSRCLYGDVLRSDDCDCGPELDHAMDMIQAEGAGVLVYLEQEGRGSGLVAKARGLAHSERTGRDTFTSYGDLGYPADCRSYEPAAAALADLGLTSVRLLTNNPEKVPALHRAGIDVTPIPLITAPRSARARAYLEAKRDRRGHWTPEFQVPPVQEPEPPRPYPAPADPGALCASAADSR